MGPSPAREEGRAVQTVQTAMNVLRRLLRGSYGGAKVRLFIAEHSGRMTDRQNAATDIIWNERGSDWLYIYSLYGTSFCHEVSEAAELVPRRAVQSVSSEDFKP